MAAPDLLTGLPLPGDVASDPLAVLSAAQRVRDYCGWHIAPSLTETVTVPVVWDWRSHRGVIVLPSLYVTAVSLVDGSAEQFTWTRGGRISLSSGRHHGDVQVTFTHGYDECPLPLLGVVLSLAKDGLTPEPQLKTKNIGPFQYGYYEQSDPLAGADAYRLPVVG